jgi:hypothetical protein
LSRCRQRFLRDGFVESDEPTFFEHRERGEDC